MSKIRISTFMEELLLSFISLFGMIMGGSFFFIGINQSNFFYSAMGIVLLFLGMISIAILLDKHKNA